MEIMGMIAPGFEPVGRVFEANFAEQGELGAACCIHVGGRKVVDIWAGVADQKTGREWSEDTLTLVYSTTKGVTAICAHHLAERGPLDIDAPVVEYWPEFGAAGKDKVTVRQLMAHRAGLPTLEPKITPEEAYAWDPAVAQLAKQAPLWEPGTRHGYHAVTYGWLVGEVIRRVSGRSVGRYLAEEIAGPLGLDVWIGLPTAEEHRVSRLRPAEPFRLGREVLSALSAEQIERLKALADPGSLLQRALNPTEPPLSFNRPELHAAEFPGANGIATARGLAGLYAATIDGLLRPETVAAATVEQSNGPDAVLGLDTRFGSGFFLPSPFSPMLGPTSFGHSGAGGSLAFADPERGVAFAYVMNQMRQELSGDPRPHALVSALAGAIDT